MQGNDDLPAPVVPPADRLDSGRDAGGRIRLDKCDPRWWCIVERALVKCVGGIVKRWRSILDAMLARRGRIKLGKEMTQEAPQHDSWEEAMQV